VVAKKIVHKYLESCNNYSS